MPDLLTITEIADMMAALSPANQRFVQHRPGQRSDRQPVHTVYGGAQIFRAGTAGKMGEVALRSLNTYAPDYATFARAFQLPGFRGDSAGAATSESEIANKIYQRVVTKLEQEPVEDFRIDFEDGFGVRPQQEELDYAVSSAREVVMGMRENTLPPFIGIRIKPLNDEYGKRSLITLTTFISTVLEEGDGTLPDNFVVTLPKITIPEQVTVAAAALSRIEHSAGLPDKSIGLELMIETPTSIVDLKGAVAVNQLVKAASGRCSAVHFGVYDYTALLEITAAHQGMRHPVCDFARMSMQVALAGSDIWLSDGATNVMPAPPHKGADLTDHQLAENIAVVHRAWRVAFGDSRHSLVNGIYQGWDLHPAQLPARYAAVYSFFLDGYEQAALRLKTFVEKAAHATLVGDVFDDAATGQGLLNYFLRAFNCSAITEADLEKTGLSIEEIQTRSFSAIIAGRVADNG